MVISLLESEKEDEAANAQMTFTVGQTPVTNHEAYEDKNWKGRLQQKDRTLTSIRHDA